MRPAQSGEAGPRLVCLEADARLRFALPAYAQALTQALGQGLGERVALATAAPGLDLEPERISLPRSADAGATAEAVAGAAARRASRLDTLVLDLSHLPPPVAGATLARLGMAGAGGLAGRLVHLTERGAMPAAPPGFSALRTDLLDAPLPQPPRPAPGGRRQGEALRRILARTLTKLGDGAPEPSGEPYPEARLSPEWCRLRLAPAALGRLSGRPGTWPEEARRSLARWARAVSHRRVGVALGGSGSWGYAHVALLQALERRGVPVDLVGGSSSGALMGAYYAALGQAGLELLIERGELFARFMWLAAISSATIDGIVDLDLDSARLDELEVLFFPVAANLTRSRAEIMVGTPVGAGVRASASAPGVFGATVTRNGVYVDGAVVDNVPVVLLERLGADLVISCNPLPPPPPVSEGRARSRLGEFLLELNPLVRAHHLGTAFQVMFHHFGRTEEAERRIAYDPPASAYPLLRTFRFDRAREIVAAVQEEPGFQAVVERSVEAWGRLTQSREPPMAVHPERSPA